MISDVEKALTGIIPEENNLYLVTHLKGYRKANAFDLGINFNSIPYNSDVAIIVTAWWNQLMYMKHTLTSYRLSGKFVICSYDNPESFSFDSQPGKLPSYEMFKLPHVWVSKHATYDAQKRNGWFWDIKYAQGIVNNFDFKYVFTVNADCIWEKPEGVDKIIEILGDGDLMASSSNCNGRSGTIHTCSVIYKIEAFNKIVDYMTEIMRVPVIGSQSPEVMLREAVQYHDLKEVKAPEQPLHEDGPGKGRLDHYNCTNQSSTWKEVLGFRNLGAEVLTYRKTKKFDKIPREYIDTKYAESKDIKALKQ